MNILMIAPQPFFQPRGTPISVLHRLNTLSQLGHKIDLVTYHLGENIPIDNVTYYRIPKVPFIKKIKIGPSKTKIILDGFLVARALTLLMRNKYDVIHSHEEAGFFGTWLAGLFHTLHLYDMHSSLPQQLTNFKFSKFKPLIKFFERLEAKTVTNADAIITICPELYKYVAQNFPHKQQLLIENVADNSQVFKTEDDGHINVKDIYQLHDHLVVLYSGTFEPYQGIDLLIEASKKVIERAPQVHFLMVGGHSDQVDNYLRKVTDMGLEDYYSFTGQVKPAEVPRFIRAADILVTPRIEGTNTPLKIYEYLRSGKPIVATNHITHTQVLNDKVAVLTELTAESLANGLLKVITDPPLRERIVKNAISLSENQYSYQTYVSKTRQIYEILAEKKQLREAKS